MTNIALVPPVQAFHEIVRIVFTINIARFRILSHVVLVLDYAPVSCVISFFVLLPYKVYIRLMNGQPHGLLLASSLATLLRPYPALSSTTQIRCVRGGAAERAYRDVF